MKINAQFILTVVFCLLLGLLSGYFIFNKDRSENTMPNVETQHDHSNMDATDETIWTCSMHPQIRQNEPGLCPICEMDLIPLEANTSNDPLVLEMTEEAIKLAQVQTTPIGVSGSGEVKEIRLSGKVQADERRASSLVSHVPGRIEKLFVTFTGEQVSTGQKLATVYSPDLIAAQKELIEAKKLIDISPGLVVAARNKLRYWKIDAKQIEQIESSGEIRETFDLFAERNGIVTQRRVSVGDYVQQGETLFEVINLSKVWILFDAYEEDLSHISIGNSIEFSSPAIPGKIFKTRVAFIDPVINAQTRTAAIRAEISNNSGTLKPEMFVNGVLQKPMRSNDKLTVPKTAVLWTGKRSVVYVKVPDTTIPSYQYREVKLGESLGDAYIISEGLEPGEEVVTNGAFSIDAAAQLNNQASMMNQNISIKRNGPEQLPDFRDKTPDEFKVQIQKVIVEYLALKDAFVLTDHNQSVLATERMMNQLEAVNTNLLSGDAFVYWKSKQQILEEHGTLLTKTKDIEAQRRQFQFLSDALIENLKVFGLEGETMYVQYCPMVFGNEGAEWISGESEIFNPYFGDKMLKCGTVKEKIE